MRKEMKVCCFCEKWGSGGIESFLVNAYEHMDRSQVSIEIVTMKQESSFFLQRLKNLNILLIPLSTSVRSLFYNHACFRRLLKEKNYDAVHLNIYHGLSLLYAWDAKRAGVPVRIAHAHGSSLRKSFLRPVKLLLHEISKHLFSSSCTKKIACSTQAAEFLFSKQTEVQIISNGIDISRFWSEKPRDTKLLPEYEGRLILCTVGRLCSEKNQTFLLDVMSELVKQRPDVLLVLVGEGELRQNLMEKAKQLKLTPNVLFYGVSHDIPFLLMEANVFVLPSLFEGLGIAAIEAQASGMPTLCSDGVPLEAIPTPLGMRLPLEAGPKAWADKIMELSLQSRMDVRKNLIDAGYSIETVASQIKRLYCGN